MNDITKGADSSTRVLAAAIRNASDVTSLAAQVLVYHSKLHARSFSRAGVLGLIGFTQHRHYSDSHLRTLPMVQKLL